MTLRLPSSPFVFRIIRSACAGVVALGLAHAAPALGGVPPGPGVDPLVIDQALVRLAPSTSLNAFLNAFNQQFPGTTVIGEIPSRQTYKLSLPAGADPILVDDLFDAQKDAGFIEWGELNYEGQCAEGKTGSLWVSQLTIGPDEYAGQYAVGTLGLAVAQTKSEGQGVIVAVLDTGVDPAHPALAGKVLDGVSFVPATGDCGDGNPTHDIGDCLDNDGDRLVDEMVGHGTFVSGLIVLVAPESKILPVVVLNSDGIGDTFSIAQGLYYAIDSGAKVINCSFGSTYKGEAVEDAVVEAWEKGVVVVGAAGNFNRIVPEEYPAMLLEPIGIAATDQADKKAAFSNYGPGVGISAPGQSDTLPNGDFDPEKSVVSALPGGDMVVWKGTSFANAFVSGAAALVRAQHPAWPANATTTSAVIGALTSTATNINGQNPGYVGLLGAGRLNAAAATALGPNAPPIGDLNVDGAVNGADLGAMLGQWGPCAGPGSCSGDLDFDGDVDGADLGLLLANWNA